MELTGNDFDFLNKKLSSLYVKAETLIEQDADPESLSEFCVKLTTLILY